MSILHAQVKSMSDGSLYSLQGSSAQDGKQWERALGPCCTLTEAATTRMSMLTLVLLCAMVVFSTTFTVMVHEYFGLRAKLRK